MAQLRGTSFRMYWNTGTDGTPTATAVGDETDATFSVAWDTTDTTNKGSGNFKEHLPTFAEVTASGTAWMDEGDTAVDKMLNDSLGGTPQRAGIEFKTINSEKYTGTFTLTNFEFTAPFDGVVGVNFTAVSSGTVSIAAA